MIELFSQFGFSHWTLKSSIIDHSTIKPFKFDNQIVLMSMGLTSMSHLRQQNRSPKNLKWF
jgi:hypothetical protein